MAKKKRSKGVDDPKRKDKKGAQRAEEAKASEAAAREAAEEAARRAAADREAENSARTSMWLLGPLVFTCGASIMALELVGVRLLAPHFGVSVYVWGSILTVFMAALALGYWAGGRIADAAPSFFVLNFMVLVAAVLICFVPYVAPTFAAPFEDLGERWGPLWASCLLFFLPSVFLAMVSPFAVRLVVSELHKVGYAAGRLYALSTIGSIFGSWVTTFVLIGWLSLTKIVLLCAAIIGALVCMNLILARGLQSHRALRGSAALGGLLLVCTLALPNAKGAWEPEEHETLLAEAETPYHRILVVASEQAEREPPYEKFPTINLHFDRYKESGIWQAPPHYSTSRYTDAFHVPLVMQRNPKHAAFIGAGGGLGPRSFRRRYPGMDIDVIDIDGKVFDYCEEYFYYVDADPFLNQNDDPSDDVEPDPLMHSHVIDGRVFIRDCFEIKRAHMKDVYGTADADFPGYDFVVLDAFTIGGRIPWHLTTREYFEEINDSLVEGGLLIMNVIGALEGKEGRPDMSLITASIYKSMAHAFGQHKETPEGFVYVFPVNYTKRWDDDPTITRNVILVAGKGRASQLPKRVFVEAARRMDEAAEPRILGDDLLPIAEDMLPLEQCLEMLNRKDAVLLTDQYCPVETMPFYDGGDE